MRRNTMRRRWPVQWDDRSIPDSSAQRWPQSKMPKSFAIRCWKGFNFPAPRVRMTFVDALELQVATFTVAPGQNLAGQHVMFLLGQYTPLHHNLGRFRLSVTSAAGPHRAQRPVVIEPILK